MTPEDTPMSRVIREQREELERLAAITEPSDERLRKLYLAMRTADFNQNVSPEEVGDWADVLETVIADPCPRSDIGSRNEVLGLTHLDVEPR